ncbi:uncharacterized protein LOC116005903 [Ipomoea triloba]|uniref:uncharacterized protein LOC116005903 n=1 Tax=Ipomoea triloba TaxID=35885 RepID=UPI00125CEEE0|nr:uncharacterized protein LOC116005903 [Ipomoea triloba]
MSNTNSTDVDELQQLGPVKPPRLIGPMDKFANQINPEYSLSSGKGKAKQRIIETFDKERSNQVKGYICRWAYEAAIPFDAFERDSFKLMVEAIGQYGPGAQGPNRYEMSEAYLKNDVDLAREALKVHEAEWKLYGCSIMTDALTNRKRRSIMNLCVNSRLDTENVVQIVTDNASNNMRAAKLLKERRPMIFWTCCATHSINILLENIAGLPMFKRVLEQAKSLTIFINAHHKTLTMMRSFTNKCDIARPGATSFASTFITLQSLADKKVELKAMFTNNEWDECKFAKTIEAKQAYSTVLSQTFWQGVELCLKVFAPLVNVLCIVDPDKKPSMGLVYGELMQAKEDIKKALNGVEKNYEPIIRIIEEKIKNRLDTPLHLMAFLLNPYYHYKDPLFHLDDAVSIGSVKFLEKYYFGDIEIQNKILKEELSKYKMKDGMFGKSIALKGCESNDEHYDPAMWWSTFGVGAPNLKRLAMKTLSLITSSFSECERN